MKKYLFLFMVSCGMLFVSCSGHISEEVDSAIAEVENSHPKKVMGLGYSYEPTLENDYDWSRTASQDAAGAKEGAGIGSTIGSFFGLESDGFLAGALVGAAYYSIVDAVVQAIEPTKELNDPLFRPYILNPTIPYQPMIESELMLDSTIEETNIGLLHNIYCERFYGCWDFHDSPDVLMQSMLECYRCENPSSVLLNKDNVISDFIRGFNVNGQLTQNLLSYRDSVQKMNVIELHNYTNVYLSSLKSQMYDIETGEIILDIISDMHAISVFYYSLLFWNPIVQNPRYAYEMIAYDSNTEQVSYVAGRTLIQDYKQRSLNQPLLYFYPVYENSGVLKAIYMYLDSSTPEGQDVLQHIDPDLFTISNTLHYHSSFGEDVEIPAGHYKLSQSGYNNGYFIEL